MARTGAVHRRTKETDIMARVEIDGSGVTSIDTGVPFFDHMLEAFGRHGLMDVDVRATGDLEIDAHHTVEDVGICMGQAFAEALGEREGIRRFGSSAVPMDEALVLSAVDISGRGSLAYEVELPIEMIGAFDTSLAKEFLVAFATNAGVTLHVHKMAGDNSHHIVEAAFKAVARALYEASSLDSRVSGVPSTKGSL
ncbi:MAG: imidazoleglycerol-phosphate dehydratase HisB [Coriobacteriia bacterium]|nr:imidazoleglycerol-phosphate dehydratase HisB [Coriobacteriia bacterium]